MEVHHEPGRSQVIDVAANETNESEWFMVQHNSTSHNVLSLLFLPHEPRSTPGDELPRSLHTKTSLPEPLHLRSTKEKIK